jgi:hypothetical protein
VTSLGFAEYSTPFAGLSIRESSMRLRKPFLVLCLVLSVMQSSGQQAPKPTIVNLQPGAQGSGLIMSADGTGPLIPRSEAPFETPKEQEQEFARQFNSLMVALREFSATYNSGHVIDVKKVKAVRKAWVELEKSGWFRAENPK